MSPLLTIARACVLCACAVAGLQARDAGIVTPTQTVDGDRGSGMIVGQVVEAGSNRPVGGAIVSLRSSTQDAPVPTNFLQVTVPAGGGGPVLLNNPAGSQRLVADADGYFAFRNLHKGSFLITATKPGYLDGAYGRLRAGARMQEIELAEGERQGEVKVRMFRLASISGTVLDDADEPVVGVKVQAYRRMLASGRRLLAPVGSASTDDRGMYRLPNLTPGDYVIAMLSVQSSVPASLQLSALMGLGGTALMSLGGRSQVTSDGRFLLPSVDRSPTLLPPDANGKMLVYPTRSYPNATTVSQASVVTVAPGEARTNVDLVLRLVPTANVSGQLVGPDGPAVNFGVHLVPSQVGDLSADPDVATSITDANGEFMFLAVPAGQYVIQAVRIGSGLPPTGGQPTADATLWTATPVSVSATNISDLIVTLRPGYKVSGRVEFQGSAERPSAERLPSLISVILDAPDGRQRASEPTGHVEADGQFTVNGLLPGKYLIRAGGSPEGWTFKASSLGGSSDVDLSDTPFEVQDHDISGLTLTFTDRPTDLRGVVKDSAGKFDSSAAVMLFASDRRSWMNYGLNARRMRIARTTKTGQYTFEALPPGDYYLVAISDEFAGEWQDPAFLDALSLLATRVSLIEGEKRTQDLGTQNVRGVIGRVSAPGR